MTITNKQKVKFIRRLFFLVCLIIAISVLVLVLLDYLGYAFIMGGVFVLWFLFFQFVDYQYIEFSDENNKILLRYYKVVRFGSTSFNSIQFNKILLHDALFENSFFGKLSDLTLVVKTKRGIAEYPTVSLSALSLNQRMEIKKALSEVV